LPKPGHLVRDLTFRVPKVIRQNHKTGERSLDLLKWGLNPTLVQRPARWS
jgi:hypothetical protein